MFLVFSLNQCCRLFIFFFTDNISFHFPIIIFIFALQWIYKNIKLLFKIILYNTNCILKKQTCNFSSSSNSLTNLLLSYKKQITKCQQIKIYNVSSIFVNLNLTFAILSTMSATSKSFGVEFITIWHPLDLTSSTG